jgi:hypothetical protein
MYADSQQRLRLPNDARIPWARERRHPRGESIAHMSVERALGQQRQHRRKVKQALFPRAHLEIRSVCLFADLAAATDRSPGRGVSSTWYPLGPGLQLPESRIPSQLHQGPGLDVCTCAQFANGTGLRQVAVVSSAVQMVLLAYCLLRVRALWQRAYCSFGLENQKMIGRDGLVCCG